jgi:hypothetical protein
VTDLTPAAMAHAIGTAPPVMDGLGHGRLEPPPAGLAWVLLVGGSVAHLDIGLERRAVDRADFDSRFGTRRSLPRVDYDRPYVLAYDVVVAGAPARCSVFGRFDEEPTSGQVEASGVTLRVDPRFEDGVPGSH